MNDNRELFEETMGRELSLARREDNTYISNTAQIAWESWQAAWNAATKRAADICADTANEYCAVESGLYASNQCKTEILKGIAE